MANKLTARQEISINAPAEKVWDALTNPEMVKKYLFGTEVNTDWKVGSPITYKGVWKGKEYEDKGKVIKNEHGRLLETTYYSPLQGKEDKPENYANVKYELFPEKDMTKLQVTQDNNETEEAKKRSEENWGMVLNGMKELLEK